LTTWNIPVAITLVPSNTGTELPKGTESNKSDQ
jgi:hypothetical protein